MKRNVFNQYLSESNFRELFITEMGWNNPSGATLLPEYTIDERTFQIEQIAERSGFRFFNARLTRYLSRPSARNWIPNSAKMPKTISVSSWYQTRCTIFG